MAQKLKCQHDWFHKSEGDTCQLPNQKDINTPIYDKHLWQLRNPSTIPMTHRVGVVDEKNFGPTLERDDWGSEGRINTLRDDHSLRNNQSLRDDQSYMDDQTLQGQLVLRGTISPNQRRPCKGSSGQMIPGVKTTCHLGFPTDIWGPSMHPFMEITCTLRPKILSHNKISYIWEDDPEYLRTFLSTKKSLWIKGFGSTLYHYISYRPYCSWGTQILSSSCTFEFLEIFSSLT